MADVLVVAVATTDAIAVAMDAPVAEAAMADAHLVQVATVVPVAKIVPALAIPTAELDAGQVVWRQRWPRKFTRRFLWITNKKR